MAPKTKIQKIQEIVFKQLSDLRDANKIGGKSYTSTYDMVRKISKTKLLNLKKVLDEAMTNETNDKFTLTGRAKAVNQANKERNIAAVEHYKQPKQDYFIKGDVEITKTYFRTRVARFNRDGRVKGEVYTSRFQVPKKIVLNDYSKIIQAKSRLEAEE